jgi:hypothetical protein
MPERPQPSALSEARRSWRKAVGITAFFIGVAMASGVFGALLVGLLALLVE